MTYGRKFKVRMQLSNKKQFAGVVRRVKGLRARMSEAGRQVDGLFEGLLSESFGGGK